MNNDIKPTNGDFEVKPLADNTEVEPLATGENGMCAFSDRIAWVDDLTELATVHLGDRSDGYQLIFTVGVQRFNIGPVYPTQDEADWFMKMFVTALMSFHDIKKSIDEQTADSSLDHG